ncbi:hypothetical protein ACTXT7_008490 [Hymenolepis weldensis]
MNVSSFDDFAYNVSSTAAELAHETSDNLKKSINLENHVNSTSYNELKEMVSSANELVKKLYESKDILVRFECEPINHLNIFWRLTMVVNCTIKLNASANFQQQLQIIQSNQSAMKFVFFVVMPVQVRSCLVVITSAENA